MSHKYTVRKVSELIPYARNSRTHTDEQVAEVAASIREFGFTNPVLVDEKGTINAGHARTRAAKKLNLEEIPCIELVGLSEAQKKAYVIADNKLPLNAGWDQDLLTIEIEELKELGMAELTGFSNDELDELFCESREDAEPTEGSQLANPDQYLVVVECANESEQEKVFEEFEKRGFKVKLV